MKQSITFDTAEDEAMDVVTAVIYAYGFDSLEDLMDPEEFEGEDDAALDTSAKNAVLPGGWTKPKMRRYVKALQPNARKVLQVIADHSPSVAVEVVQSKSGLQGYHYAGSMSSFGFAARNTHGVKQKPFEKVGKDYQMHMSVAALVLEVLNEQ